MSREFKLGLDTHAALSANGKVCGRVVLSVDGQQVDAQRLTLDSSTSCNAYARRMAERHGIDGRAVAAKLGELCLLAMQQQEEHRQRRQAAAAEHEARIERAERLAVLTDRFIHEAIDPAWHRNRKSIYSRRLAAEVSLSALWTHAADEHIDAVAGTAEGIQAGRNGEPPSWRTCLQLFRDAVAMAASRAIQSVPDVLDTEKDETVNAADLLARLEAWLLKTRTQRVESTTYHDESIYDWAAGLANADGWLRFGLLPVWARLPKGAERPEVAAKGSHLADELRAESLRRLAGDLRAAGLVDTDHTLKCEGHVWRAWLLSAAVIDGVAIREGNANEVENAV